MQRCRLLLTVPATVASVTSTLSGGVADFGGGRQNDAAVGGVGPDPPMQTLAGKCQLSAPSLAGITEIKRGKDVVNSVAGVDWVESDQCPVLPSS